MAIGFIALNSMAMDYINYRNIFMDRSLRSQGLSWIGGAIFGVFLFSYLHYSNYGALPSVTEAPGLSLAAFAGMMWAAAIQFSNRKLDAFVPWHTSFSLRFLAGYIGDALITTTASYLFIALSTLTDSPRTLIFGGELLIKACIVSALTLFVYRIIYALMYSYKQYTIAQVETVKSARRQLELQFQALKSQISPHYLFNSLNTISSLMIKDAASAEQFIRRLAQTYQYVLNNQDKMYVLLEEEIEFVKSYYYLLRIRFQHQVEVEINVTPAILKSRIPPLTLQMLVENAVKHNTMRSDQKLFIYITAKDNTYLRVINTKASATSNVESFNVGLENIRKRYQFFTRESIVINDTEKFSVALPVLHPIINHQTISA